MSHLILHKVRIMTGDEPMERARLSTASMTGDNEIHTSDQGNEIDFLRRVLERLENLDEGEALVIRKVVD